MSFMIGPLPTSLATPPNSTELAWFGSLKKKKKTEKTRTEYLRIVDNYKSCTTNVMRIPEGEGESNRRIFDVNMVKHFPKLMKDIKAQIQETQRTTSSIDTKKIYT